MSSERDSSPSVPRLNFDTSQPRTEASEARGKTESAARNFASAARADASQARANTESAARNSASAARADASQARANTESAARNSASAARSDASQARVNAESAARASATAAARSATASQARPEASKAASAVRPSTATTATAAGSSARPSARPPIAVGGARGGPAVAARGGRGGAAAAGGADSFSGPTPKVATPFAQQDYSGFPPDTVKFLKEVNAARDGAVQLRVLPKSQQLQQLLLLETTQRAMHERQEESAFAVIGHRRAEDAAKRAEQSLAAASKERAEGLKARQQEELAAAREDTIARLKQMETDVKERLGTLARLQPRLGVPAAVLALLKSDDGDVAVLGRLLEEDKRLQKALKGDARYAKSRTADTDGGAFPYYLRDCAAASFNVAAILAGSPLRAAVEDAVIDAKGTPASDKKVVVVRDDAQGVVAWAHVRGTPDAPAAAAAFLEAAPAPSNLPADAGRGVLWCKEDLAELARKAKAANSPIAGIVDVSTAVIAVGDVASAELSRKEVEAIGEAAAA